MSKVVSFLKRIHYNSPVILSFTLLCLLVLVINIATGNMTLSLLFSAYRSPLTDPLMYVRVFGHVLGHASFEHYFGNMLLILLVGPMLEEKYGSRTLIIMMLFTAVTTGLVNMLLFSSALLGASGIVFAMILLSSYANYEDGRIPLTLILIVFVFIGKEIVDGLFTVDNISHITHIIGGLCGCIFGLFIAKKNAKKSVEIKE